MWYYLMLLFYGTYYYSTSWSRIPYNTQVYPDDVNTLCSTVYTNIVQFYETRTGPLMAGLFPCLLPRLC